MSAALSIMAVCPSCSLILDFDQTANDAAIDAPYTQAQCDYMEPNDSTATAMMITASDTGPAAICAPTAMGGAEDADYYKFTVSSTTVTVSIAFTNRAGGDLDIKLLAADGTMQAHSRGFGDGEMIVCPGTSPSCPMLPAGDYLLHVFPAVTGSVNAYTFMIMP